MVGFLALVPNICIIYALKHEKDMKNWAWRRVFLTYAQLPSAGLKSCHLDPITFFINYFQKIKPKSPLLHLKGRKQDAGGVL